MIKLVDDWRWVAKHAWSLRATVIAVVLSGAEVVLPLFTPRSPPPWYALVLFLVVAGAAASRLIAQKKGKDGE